MVTMQPALDQEERCCKSFSLALNHTPTASPYRVMMSYPITISYLVVMEVVERMPPEGWG